MGGRGRQGIPASKVKGMCYASGKQDPQGQEGKGSGLGASWEKRSKQIQTRTSPVSWTYVSSHTEIKCKFLAFSCRNLYAQGMSLFHKQERESIPLWVEPSSQPGWLYPFPVPCRAGLLWGRGRLLPRPTLRGDPRKHRHPSSQSPSFARAPTQLPRRPVLT